MALSTNDMYKTIRPAKKKKIIVIVILVITLVIAGVIFGIMKYKAGENVVTYSTVQPHIGDISATVSASGTINAINEVKVGSQISGTIIEVKVVENDAVKKGDILAIINPETIYQTIDRYKAQLGSAKALLHTSEITMSNKKWNYEQMQKLYKATKGKSPSLTDLRLSKLDYETAAADVQVKKASIKEVETNLKSAEIDLKNSIIVSPIDGVILKKSIEAGQTVAASFSTPELFTVAENLEKMKLAVNVSEADVGKVKEGQKVTFSVDTFPDDTFTSTVYRVNMGSSDSTDNIVSYETTIYIDNPEFLLRSGMSATADIETAGAKSTILIPVAALYFNPDELGTGATDDNKRKFGMNMRPRPKVIEEKKAMSKNGTVWVLKNGTPEKINIETGVSDGKNVQIISDEITTESEIIIGIKTKK